MPRLHADHIRILVIAKVAHLARLVQPRIPDDRVRKVVLLQPHLPPRHHVRYDMLLGRVLVHSVRPLVHRDDVAALLVDRAIARLVNERAAVEARDLAATDVGHFQVRVQQEVEGERDILRGIVDADVKVELFLAQDQAISDPKAE